MQPILHKEEIHKILKLYPQYDSLIECYIGRDNRRRVRLFNSVTKKRTLRQLAKVRLEAAINRLLEGDETVDHINNDKTDDSLNNLQILSKVQNSRKGRLYQMSL